jgi:hypothetical protein
MYNIERSLNEKINPLINLFVFNTGILNRAGGLNPTAVIFCIIEKHIEEDFIDILNLTN